MPPYLSGLEAHCLKARPRNVSFVSELSQATDDPENNNVVNLLETLPCCNEIVTKGTW